MGDFRIVIEGVGGHGCGRDNSTTGEERPVTRCRRDDCPDCQAAKFARTMGGATVSVARLEHWPVPGAAGTTRSAEPGPVDDLLKGTRVGSWTPPYTRP